MYRLVFTIGSLLILSSVTLAQVELPKPTGPFPVGTATYTWVDGSREEVATNDPSDRREVIVQLWYPAQPAAGAAVVSYFPELPAALEIMRTKFGARGEQMAELFAPLGRIQTHAFPNAPVATRQSSYPVLLFSPGGDMSRHFYTVQAEELASHGYIVAVMSHAYSTFDLFPNDRLLTSHPRWNPARGASEEERDKHFEELTNILSADASFVLMQLEQLNKKDTDGRFTGKLDFGKMAILGHSRGGKTVSRVLVTEPRVPAGIIYDNLPPMAERVSGYKQPTLMMRTSEWEEGDAAELNKLMEKSRSGGYVVTVEGSGHRNFSDAHLTSPDRFKSEIDARRALQIINAYTLAFLEQQFTGKASPLLEESARTYPEAKLTVFGKK